MRTISPDGLKQMFAQNAEDVWLALITITHSSLGSPEIPYRFVNDMQDLSYGGNTYTAIAFNITLPVDDESRVATPVLTIDNVTQDMVAALRNISDHPTLSLEVVRRDTASPATTTNELGPLDFTVMGYRNSADTIEFALGYEVDVLNERATTDHFDPATAPALFS